MYGIYFELARDENDVWQGLFIPASMVGTSVIPPTLAYRSLTGTRRAYSIVQNKEFGLHPAAAPSTAKLISDEIGQLDGLSVFLTDPLSDPSRTLRAYGPIQVSTVDQLNLLETPTRIPADLADRIRGVRESMNLPKLPGNQS